MPKLDRLLFTRYGKDGVTNDFGQFGSKAAGTPLKTKDILAIQGLSAWLDGAKNALISGVRAPFLEDFNGWMYVMAYMTAYMFEAGVPEWEANTTYFVGCMVRKPGTSQFYSSLVDNNLGNALPAAVDDTNWKYCPFLFDGAVTAAKLAADAVVAGKIAAGAVDDPTELVDGVVTTPKLDTNAVSYQQATGIVFGGTSGSATGAATSVTTDGPATILLVAQLKIQYTPGAGNRIHFEDSIARIIGGVPGNIGAIYVDIGEVDQIMGSSAAQIMRSCVCALYTVPGAGTYDFAVVHVNFPGIGSSNVVTGSGLIAIALKK